MLNSDETIQHNDSVFLLPPRISRKKNASYPHINVENLFSSDFASGQSSPPPRKKRQSAPCTIHKAFHSATSDSKLRKDRMKPLLRGNRFHANNDRTAHQGNLKLLEQIHDLAHLKLGNSKDTDKIIQFSKLIFESHNWKHLYQFNNSDKISLLLGQMIFLIDRSPELLLQQSENPNLIQAAFKIEETFERSLKQIQRKMVEIEEHQLATGLKEEKLAKNTQLPVEISQLLITSTGIINYHLIPKIIREFIENKDSHRNYPLRLQVGLNALFRSEKLRNQIELSSLPESANDPGAVLVRVALNTPPEKKVSNIDAMQAILAAFLTHHRQGRSGSCFAAFLAIGLQNSKPENTIQDMQDLVSKGELERTVNGKNIGFPYLLKISPEELSNPLPIDAEGNLLSSKKRMSVIEIPGMAAVCHFLEILNPQEVLKKWLLNQEPGAEGLMVTVNQLIAGICTDYSPEEIDLARMVYCSQTTNPVLSSWENAIAGMAEAQNDSLLQSALVQTATYFLDKLSKKYQPPLEADTLTKLKSHLESILQQRGRYLYDPAYQAVHNPKGQGAFILYDTRNDHDPSKWKRMDSIESFELFIQSILKETFKTEPFFDSSVQQIELVEDFISEPIMTQLLKKYHNENRLALANNKPISDLKYTPWVTFIGNNPEAVLQTYQESEKKPQVDTIRPTNASELLNIIHEKINSRMKKGSENENFIPIRIQGVHTFSLLNNHPSLNMLSKQKKAVAKWIQEKTIIPGNETSKIFLTPFIKESILQLTFEHLKKQELIDQIKDKFKSTDFSISIQEFRNQLLIELYKIIPPTISQSKIQRELDLKITQLLPSPLRKMWETSIIHFADSNWQSGGHDIHYGIGINPGSGTLELFLVLDDGQIYAYLDQKKYFGSHPWELFLDVEII